MPTKEMQTDITSHMRKLIKQEHGCDEPGVPYGVPCTPEEWSWLDDETKKALSTYVEAMGLFLSELRVRKNDRNIEREATGNAPLEERDCAEGACDQPVPGREAMLKDLVKVRHSPSIHEDKCVAYCGLPESKTREEYVYLAKGLLKAINRGLANERNVHLLAALIAYAQELREGEKPARSRTLLDEVMNLISDNFDLTDKSKDYITTLFGELETARRFSSDGFCPSPLTYKGRWLTSWRRRDGAPGLDETQSDALSLYHEYLRLKNMQSKYCEMSTIKRHMRVYLPLLNRGVRKHYYTEREQEMGSIEQDARSLYEQIEDCMSDGVEIDLLEGLEIDALMKCIQDERVGTNGKVQQLAKLKAIADDMRERRFEVLHELDPFVEEVVARLMSEDETGEPKVDRQQDGDTNPDGGDC